MTDQSKPNGTFPLFAAFAAYTAAFVAVASPWLLGFVQIPYDAASQFYPPFAFIARSLGSGQLPFWTPNVFAGWPLIADPQSLIFSPLHVAVALFDASPGRRLFDWLVFATLYAGGAGVILYFRDREWHAAGAVVAALAFALGGSAASRIQHVGQLQSLVFLALSLWMLARALERRSVVPGAIAGLFAGLVVLGRDQVALVATYTLVGYVVWHWFDGEGRWQRFVRSLKPLAAGAIVGALIVTVPVILTVLLAESSNRPDISFDTAVQGSLHPLSLAMLLFADVYGAGDFHREFWGPPSFPWHDFVAQTGLHYSQNVGQIYCGAMVAVAVIGLGLQRQALWAREIRFFTVAASMVLLYMIGKYTPVFRLMYDWIPGVAFYRRPADATFVFCGLLAIIGGYLVHRFAEGTLPAPPRWQRVAAVAGVLALAVILTAFAHRIGVLGVTVLPMLWGLGLLAGAAAALVLTKRLSKSGAVAATLLVATFSAADLGWSNAPNESTGLPASRFGALDLKTDDATVIELKSRLKAASAPDRRDRVELIAIDYHWANIGLVHDFDHLYGHNPLRLLDYARATRAPDTVAGGFRPFTPLMPSYRSTLFDLFGVRFLAMEMPIEKIEPGLKPGTMPLVARTKQAYIYENPRALPRVLLASRWQKADFDALLRNGPWPDVDPRSTVLLEQEPAKAPNGAADGRVSILHYFNTDIEIEADAPSGGFVVLNDVWHPWWRASVDGLPAEILKANVLFRAVVVPPGKHIVRFTFHPFAGAWAELFGKLSVLRP